jgi:hypothetical protein
MRPSSLLLRAALVGLAFAHSFPARKHIAAFFEAPSLAEAWKGFGAAAAVALYLLPPTVYVRALGWLWTRRRAWLSAAGILLAVAHLVPAFDHLPRFVESPTWTDGWRGVGALLAFAWFATPLSLQARVVRRLRLFLSALNLQAEAEAPRRTPSWSRTRPTSRS